MRHNVAPAVVVLLVMSVVPALVVRGQSTPQTVRVSGLVSLLDQDMAAFGLFANFAGVGNAPLDAITHAGDRTIDLVMYDLEHSPFDVAGLQTYIQFLLDPGAIARAGDVRASKTVIARIPVYGRELDKNTWMVKNVLDVGVHGIVFPHIETPEQAFTAIRAMRYPASQNAVPPAHAGAIATSRLKRRYGVACVMRAFGSAPRARSASTNSGLFRRRAAWSAVYPPPSALGAAPRSSRRLVRTAVHDRRYVHPVPVGAGGDADVVRHVEGHVTFRPDHQRRAEVVAVVSLGRGGWPRDELAFATSHVQVEDRALQPFRYR